MRDLICILCIYLTFFSSIASASDGLAVCPGFDARAEKVKKFDLRSKLLNKNVKSSPGDSVNWFAGGWGVDNEGGHVPSGSTKHQNFGFSLWPLHGPTVNSDDPRNHPENSLNWKSITITCSGDNCGFINTNVGYSAFYTCEASGTTTFTATGTYLDNEGK